MTGNRSKSRCKLPQAYLPLTARQKQVGELYKQLGSGMAVARQLKLQPSTVYEALRIYTEKLKNQKDAQ